MCYLGSRKKHGLYRPQWSMYQEPWEDIARKSLLHSYKRSNRPLPKHDGLLWADNAKAHNQLSPEREQTLSKRERPQRLLDANSPSSLHASPIKGSGSKQTWNRLIYRFEDTGERFEVLPLSHIFPSDFRNLRTTWPDRSTRVYSSVLARIQYLWLLSKDELVLSGKGILILLNQHSNKQNYDDSNNLKFPQDFKFEQQIFISTRSGDHWVQHLPLDWDFYAFVRGSTKAKLLFWRFPLDSRDSQFPWLHSSWQWRSTTRGYRKAEIGDWTFKKRNVHDTGSL